MGKVSTNFEQWKDSLAPEALLHEGYHAGFKYKAVVFPCSHCPAVSCPRKVPGNLIRDAICEDEFLRWAAAPMSGGKSKGGDGRDG